MLNFSVFFEFELVPCFAFAHSAFSMQLFPTSLRQSQTYYLVRTTIAMGSQTVGPILTIMLLTIVTEYKVHSALKARRMWVSSIKSCQFNFHFQSLRVAKPQKIVGCIGRIERESVTDSVHLHRYQVLDSQVGSLFLKVKTSSINFQVIAYFLRHLRDFLRD